MRQGDFDYFGTLFLQVLDGGFGCGPHGGIQSFGEVFAGNADAQSSNTFFQINGIVGHFDRQAGGVEGVVTGDALKDQCGVLDGPGQRADLVERGGKSDEAVTRDPAVGRLHADNATVGRGLADRASGVGPECHGHKGCGHRSGGAPRRSAGNVARRGGVVGFLQRGIFRCRAHCELIEIGATEKHRAGVAQPAGDAGIVGRAVIFREKTRAAGAWIAKHIDVVLECDRNATERLRKIGQVGGGTDAPGVQREKGTNVLFAGADLGEQVVENVRGFDFSFDQKRAQGADGLTGKAHKFSGVGDNFRHAHLELGLVGRVVEQGTLRQALPRGVLAHRGIDGKRIGRGFDPGDIERGKLLDVAEDGVELSAEGNHLLVRKFQAGESGDAADIHVRL